MNLTSGIEKFVAVASHCPEREEVLKALQSLRTTRDYRCPAVSVFALHLILDLYSEDSSLHANISRMTVNLETAADELLYLSKRLRALG